MTVIATLNEFIETELIKKGFDEITNGKELVYFDSNFALSKKIMSYDEDVAEIVNQYFFLGHKLVNPDNDKHFKKGFMTRFLNREINRQTFEAFSMQVVYTFMTTEDYVNRIYTDLDKYLANTQINKQENDSSNITDNRSAFSELPQNNVQLDVNDTVMTSANDNTISRNKQTNNGKSNGETSNFRLDELFKINGLLDQVYTKFDENCFLQVW